jgi:hypothetical protein
MAMKKLFRHCHCHCLTVTPPGLWYYSTEWLQGGMLFTSAGDPVDPLRTLIAKPLKRSLSLAA